MTDQNQVTNIRQLENSKRQERAHRILDAAAALILRWGYNKTTIDDIARQAGVAKGTIYLHWKTREELFTALMKREKLEMSEDFSQRIVADPAGPALRNILKHSALALMKRPVLKAALLGDLEVLGKLVQHEQQNTAYLEKLIGFNTYLEFLREHGWVRTDLSLRAQVYIVSAIFMGFFLIEPLMPEEYRFSDEELAELMAETVHGALESKSTTSPDELKTVSPAFNQYLNQAVERAREQFRQELD